MASWINITDTKTLNFGTVPAGHLLYHKTDITIPQTDESMFYFNLPFDLIGGDPKRRDMLKFAGTPLADFSAANYLNLNFPFSMGHTLNFELYETAINMSLLTTSNNPNGTGEMSLFTDNLTVFIRTGGNALGTTDTTGSKEITAIRHSFASIKTYKAGRMWLTLDTGGATNYTMTATLDSSSVSIMNKSIWF